VALRGQWRFGRLPSSAALRAREFDSSKMMVMMGIDGDV
jgi:hypothetical protein